MLNVIEPVFVVENEFDYREKKTTGNKLWNFQPIGIGDASFQEASKSRKLLIWTLMDVMQPVVTAKICVPIPRKINMKNDFWYFRFIKIPTPGGILAMDHFKTIPRVETC